MHREIILTGASGQLFGRLWTPVSETKGVVIVVHGLGDHSGRYLPLAKFLVARRWAVFAYDQQGHGYSPGRRGCVGRYVELLADIDAACRTMHDVLGSDRQVLLGHSMGGNLVLNYRLRQNEFGSALPGRTETILAAPMILPPRSLDRPMMFAAWMTGHALRHLRMRFGQPKHTDVPNQSVDRLRHGRLNLYLATQLLVQGRWALDHARQWDSGRAMILMGQRDQQIDQAACRHLAIRAASQITLKTLPRFDHDLLTEGGEDGSDVPTQPFQAIHDWVTNKVA